MEGLGFHSYVTVCLVPYDVSVGSRRARFSFEHAKISKYSDSIYVTSMPIIASNYGPKYRAEHVLTLEKLLPSKWTDLSGKPDISDVGKCTFSLSLAAFVQLLPLEAKHNFMYF